MNYFKTPFQLGNLTLSSNVFCSALAGCSDFPFRKMTTQYKSGLVFCEMVKMDALIRHDPNTYRILDYDKSMHPIGAQLCGSKPKIAGACAKIIEELGFDVVDLNCGCPVDKVTKDNSGSGMLKYPQLIGETLANIVAAVKIPVTVKVRAGWDESEIVAPLITKIAEEAGAVIIFVHGRTRMQGYKGPACWDYIKACKRVAKTIKVFGNGDLFDAKSAEEMFLETECDGLLLARGTMGQPWLVQDIYRHFLKLPKEELSAENIKEVLLAHLEHVERYQSPRKAALDLRRIGSWYLKRISGEGIKHLREAVAKTSNVEEVVTKIKAYPWHTASVAADKATLVDQE